MDVFHLAMAMDRTCFTLLNSGTQRKAQLQLEVEVEARVAVLELVLTATVQGKEKARRKQRLHHKIRKMVCLVTPLQQSTLAVIVMVSHS